MQWNFSPTIEIGQYVALLSSESLEVSRRGTHLACPGFRQCISTSNTPSESKIAGSPSSEKNTDLSVPPVGNATTSPDWIISSFTTSSIEYTNSVVPARKSTPLPIQK